MAQPNGSHAIEEHVEKAVLALCAILLIYGLFRWGFSSPRAVEIGRQTRRLDEADKELLKRAERIQRTTSGKEVEVPALPDYDEMMNALQVPGFAARHGLLATMGGAARPLKAAAQGEPEQRKKPSLSSLLPLLRPDKPHVVARLELPRTPEELKDTRTCHAGLVYPLGQIAESWREKLRDTRMIQSLEPVVLGVKVRVQEKGPDGEWSEPRDVDVTTIPWEDLRGQEFNALRETIRSYRGQDTGNALAAVRQLQSEGHQERILMPPYWQIFEPKTRSWVDWKRGVVEGLLEKVQPSETETPSEAGPRRAPAVYTPPAKTRYPPEVHEYRPVTGSGRRGRIPEATGPGSTERPPYSEDWPAAEVEPGPAPEIRTGLGEEFRVPALAEQKQTGKVLVWFHATGLADAKVYRYQVRLELVNPFLGCGDQSEHPADGAVATIATEWSEWSGEISVPKSTVFYLTGKSSSANEAVVTVFTRVLGQPVKQAFYVKPGDPIGGQKNKDVLDPVAEQWVTREVDFFTGAIAVAFDFAKEVVTRGKLPESTTEMLYLDAKGSLTTRTQAEDMASKDYRQWNEALPAESLRRPVPVAPRPGLPGLRPTRPGEF